MVPGPEDGQVNIQNGTGGCDEGASTRSIWNLWTKDCGVAVAFGVVLQYGQSRGEARMNLWQLAMEMRRGSVRREKKLWYNCEGHKTKIKTKGRSQDDKCFASGNFGL